MLRYKWSSKPCLPSRRLFRLLLLVKTQLSSYLIQLPESYKLSGSWFKSRLAGLFYFFLEVDLCWIQLMNVSIPSCGIVVFLLFHDKCLYFAYTQFLSGWLGCGSHLCLFYTPMRCNIETGKTVYMSQSRLHQLLN